MEAKRMHDRFQQVEQAIERAAQVCQNDRSASEELKESVRELDDQSRQAHEFLQSADNDEAIRQCIDDLEELGDRAKDACEHSPNLDGELRSVVMQAHRELSELKHQLH